MVRPTSVMMYSHLLKMSNRNRRGSRFLMPGVLSTTYLPPIHEKVRTFAAKGNSNNNNRNHSDQKNKIMKRQLQQQQQPEAPSFGTPTVSQPTFQRLPPMTSSFQIHSPYQDEGSISTTGPSSFSKSSLLGSPIQVLPSLTWETDKQREQSLLFSSSSSSSSLSSLPDDDAISLLDKVELFDPSIHLPYAPKDWTGYEPATPLSDFLMSKIGVTGRAITTAEYMQHALTHPSFGYYTNPPSLQDKGMGGENDDDLFDTDLWEKEASSTTAATNGSTLIGPRGDFVTAPEVSHVFGHCLCVWFVTQWQSPLLNKPERIQLVELGPGRGTLMADLLELATASSLQDTFGRAINNVHLVEASRVLRQEQEQCLKERLGHLIEFEFVHVSSFLGTSTTTSGQTVATTKDDNKIKTKTTTSATDATTSSKTNTNNEESSSSSAVKERPLHMRIEWHDTFSSFSRTRDKNIPVFVIAQEFLDALPVHSFQKTKDGWRERLIDVASVEDDDEATKAPPSLNKKDQKDSLRPRLRQVLAPDVTPAYRLFLEPNQDQYNRAAEGSVVEVCPEAIMLVQDIANVLEESQGVGLLIDYGQEGTGDTLRAFSNHQQVPLTSRPGQVDVTADVDFFALKHAVTPSNRQKSLRKDQDDELLSLIPSHLQIHAFGPVLQGEFLMRMGIADMVINSIEQETTSPEHAQKLSDALKYLVLPEHMGEKFKVLALAQKRDGIFAPAGMET